MSSAASKPPEGESATSTAAGEATVSVSGHGRTGGKARALGLLAPLLLAYHPLFVRSVPEASASDLSPGLVVILFAWLVLRRRRALRASLEAVRGWAPALPWLFLALALGLWSRHTGAVDLLIPSLAAMLLGAAWLLGGAAAFRSLVLPAAFLLFAFPAPAVLFNQLMYPLQRATAWLAAWMLGLLGRAPNVSGDLLWVDGEAFEVIESCSGIGSIEALTVAAVVFADLSYRNRLQFFVLLASAPVVAFLVNGVRVLTIIGDPTFDPEAGHAIQGLIMILVGAFLLTRIDALLAWLQGDASERAESRGVAAPPAAPPREAPFSRWIFLGVWLGLLAAAPLFVPEYESADSAALRLSDAVPETLGGWRGVAISGDHAFLGSVRGSDAVQRRYRRSRGAVVDVFVGTDERRARGASLLSPKTEHPGFGWRVVERTPFAPSPRSGRAEWLLLRSPASEHLVLHRTEGAASVGVEIARALLALDQSFLRRPQPLRVERFGTRVVETPGGRRQAEKRVARLAAQLDELRARVD